MLGSIYLCVVSLTPEDIKKNNLFTLTITNIWNNTPILPVRPQSKITFKQITSFVTQTIIRNFARGPLLFSFLNFQCDSNNTSLKTSRMCS